MGRSLTVVAPFDVRGRGVASFEEQLKDHDAILEGYLTTHITRNHSDATRTGDRRFLYGWFAGQRIRDDTQKDGERQLLLWEAMEPVRGRERIVEFSKGLVLTGLKPRTVLGYLGTLRRLFEYVLEFPYIPSAVNGTQGPPSAIAAKYNRIEQPVLEYDYPLHVLDNEEEGFALTGDALIAFYDFIRLQYLPNNQKKATAARDYAMIVLAAESGLRADEMRSLDVSGPHRDLFYERGRIQTRSGKGTKGSGKRTRKTIFTPFAQATIKVYEKQVRPAFPSYDKSPALFLSESGERLSYNAMWHALSVIVRSARKAGLELSPRFGWHSLRKSFATTFMENYPERIWVLMDMMGHISPSTLNRYVKHSRSFYDRAIDSMISDLVPNPPIPAGEKNADCLESEKVAGRPA